MENKENRFEMTREYWRKEFLRLDQEELIKRFDLKYDDENMYITYYSREYSIDRTSGTIYETGEPDKKIGFSPLMSIYHLFYFSKPDAKVKGEFVPFRQVKNASPFAPNFEKSVKNGFAIPFDGKKDKLIHACKKLGGKKVPHGEVGYVFEALKA